VVVVAAVAGVMVRVVGREWLDGGVFCRGLSLVV